MGAVDEPSVERGVVVGEPNVKRGVVVDEFNVVRGVLGGGIRGLVVLA